MKSNRKTISLIILGIFLAFLPIFTNNQCFIARYSIINSNCNDEFDNVNLKISAVSGKIHIDNNWTDARDEGICTGNGTYSEPYIIEDMEIDGGGSGSCILIEDSDVYFEIRNCTLYNAGLASIQLNNVIKGKLTLNNCTSINYYGIYLTHCDNTTISENTVNNNSHGIELSQCYNCSLSENIMNKCSLTMSGTLEQLNSHNISNSNLVNGKPLYYYKNKLKLKPNNFLDAGQVILVNCNNSLLTNLVISFSEIAISLFYCYNNTISGNTVYNNDRGIYFASCENSTILGNIANDNNVGLELYSCVGNIISGNVVNDNQFYGIRLDGIVLSKDCHNNTISGNIVSNNNNWGIFLVFCYDIVVSENIANNNKYGIFLDTSQKRFSRYTILGNIANDNSFYGINVYYVDSSTILGNIVNDNGNAGIHLDHSDFNTISKNTIDDNSRGIHLETSTYNIISGNTLQGNDECIVEENCQGNEFSDNGDCTYGQRNGGVPIELIVLISVISGGAVIGVATFLLIRRKRKRIE